MFPRGLGVLALWPVPLFALLVSVVAGLAQTLQVSGIPEQRLVTTMRPLVITHQL